MISTLAFVSGGPARSNLPVYSGARLGDDRDRPSCWSVGRSLKTCAGGYGVGKRAHISTTPTRMSAMTATTAVKRTILTTVSPDSVSTAPALSAGPGVTVRDRHARDVRKDGVNTRKTDTIPLLVLSFVTPDCRACSYASRAFARLAREFSHTDTAAGCEKETSDRNGNGSRSSSQTRRNVKFLTIDISQRRNHSLGIRLGVDAVPAFHTYALLPSENPSSRLDSSADSFAVLDQHVGARVVEKLRKRLLHFVSPDFNLNDYVFEQS